MVNTPLNISPYFDDFNAEKDFTRVLFKPSVAVQARELNQIQSIIQSQIERFGDNIYKRGTVIKGCNFTTDSVHQYVKILDLDVSGNSINVSDYDGQIAEGLTTGLRAEIVNVASGLESQSPDLATLYIKYLNTGSSSEKVFSSSEQITITNKETGEEIVTVVAAGSVNSAAIGTGYAVHVSDGIVYQKGHFLRVQDQTVIVSKYSNTPTDVMVGFSTAESIVNSNQDNSLLDNSSGFNNSNAPGADRLKMVPELIVVTDSESIDDEDFFTLIEFENGNIIRRRTRTQFNVIGDELARRTNEESGNYIVQGYDISIREHRTEANTKISAVVGPGIGYIDGYRLETFNDLRIDVDKATDFTTEESYVVSTNYGQYVIVNNFLGNFDFNDASEILLYNTAQVANTTLPASTASLTGTQIGTARIRSLMYNSGTVGDSDAEYRLYLFDIQMDSNSSFEDVKSVYHDGTNKGVADLILESGAATLKEFSFRPMLFDIGQTATKSIRSEDGTNNAEYIFKTFTDSLVVASATGQVTVTLSVGEWPFGVGTLNNSQKQTLLLVCNETQSPYTDGVPIDLSGATVTVTSTTAMTITLASAPAADMDVTLFYNVKKDSALQANKQQQEIYIKIDAATHSANTTGKYSLGLPDVTEILGVWQGSTYAEDETEVTDSFILDTAQNDIYYGLSKVIKKSALTIGAADKLLFKVKVFKKDVSGGGAGFFSVDSYSVDVEDIPVYTSETGRRYNLRDCIDFRLFSANTAAYSNTIASATENPSFTVSFGSSELYIPAPNETFESDIQFYLPRIDLLVMDRLGTMKVIEGTSDYSPVAPTKPVDVLKFGEIKVAPFPSLTSSEANQSRKPEYAVQFVKTRNRRYTMQDIGQIDDRVSRLEYYSALSLLEQEAKDLSIVDSSGLDRFKNGIFVDNFNDLISANVQTTEFSAALDLEESSLVPKFRQTNIPLRIVSNSSVVTDSGKTTLTFSDREIIAQPYATRTRNCVENFYKFNGSTFISPRFDGFFDATRSPDFVLDNTENTPLSDFATGNINEMFQMMNARIANPMLTTTRIGDFVSSVSFLPYIRSREVNFLITGLRPGATHYFYFDGVDVTDSVATADYRAGSTETLENLRRIGSYGSVTGIAADSTGTIKGIFRIPAGQFIVGDRDFEAADVSSYTDIGSATSRSKTTYSAFNFSAETRSLATVIPPSSGRIGRRRGEFGGEGGGGNGGDDPIAQTFIVKANHNPDNEIVMVSKIDLFFKTKSSNNGITVSIRTVDNGVPTRIELPYAVKHLSPSEVNVSNTAATATTIEFDSPIPLKVDHEYAIVVKPDANDPNYTIWTAQVGQDDVSSSVSVTQDWGDGVMFTSTNDSAWSAYQDEDLKFTVYRADFTASSGSITFAADNPEFFTCNTVSGSFVPEEYVYANDAVVSAQTVAIVSNSANVAGIGTTFNSTFVAGEHIVIVSNTVIDVHEVKTVTNATHMVLVEPAKVSNSSAEYFKSVAGIVDKFENSELTLKRSSAKSGLVWAANSTVVGVESGASATIESVDDLNVSYLQPNFYKVNYINTKTTLSANLVNTSYDFANNTLNFGDTKYLIKRPVVVPSRSNEITSMSENRGFQFTLDLFSTSAGVSPIVESDQSTINTYRYIINSNTENEHTTVGEAETKYVSKIIQLGDQLDADDIKVFLTAYKPSGTSIEVWGKFKNISDPDSFNDKVWTKLDAVSVTDVFSSSTNREDFREFEFQMPTSDPSADADLDDSSAWLNSDTLRYTSEGGAIYDGYRLFAIKIIMLGDNFNVVPRVKDMRTIALSS